MISLKWNPMKSIDSNAFVRTTVKVIETTDYHICCVAPLNSECPAIMPWYFSCSKLLPTLSMTITFIVVSILIMVTNVSSLVLHALSNRSNKCYTLTVISINLNDTLCGIYLCIIWIANFAFKETFSAKEENWRSSSMCLVAFGFALRFNITSPLFLFLMSVSRLMVVVHPIETIFKQPSFITKITLCVCTSICIIFIIVTLLIKFMQNTLPSSLCSPFIDPNNSVFLIKILIWFVATEQMSMSIIIIVLHCLLVKNIKISQKNVKKSKSHNHSKSLLILQLL